MFFVPGMVLVHFYDVLKGETKGKRSVDMIRCCHDSARPLPHRPLSSVQNSDYLIPRNIAHL